MSIVAGTAANASDFNFLFGSILAYAGRTAPDANWKICDGSAISRTTYAMLFGIITPSVGTFTVTLASPGVFTLTSHGLVAGDAVYLTTTGALPTGLSQNTLYYIISAGLTANAFELSATRGGAAINTSGSQSGTHTLRYCPWGLGDGSTTFNLPDLRQRVPVGYMSADTDMGYVGQTGGEKTHTLTAAEIAAHTHNQYNGGGAFQFGTIPKFVSLSNGGSDTQQVYGNGTGMQPNSPADGAHNNLQPYATVNYIIRVL